MENPWTQIELEEYESHMSYKSVQQLQAMSNIMKQQLYTYPVQSVMILGVAGGNGLEHIKEHVFKKVYGVDINENYLAECRKRYTHLGTILETVCADLSKEDVQLPYAELVIANLLVEFIGENRFVEVIGSMRPKYVSCTIQVDESQTFVSDSPYIHTLECLAQIHHEVEERNLTQAMEGVGYNEVLRYEQGMQNGKKLVRLDFIQNE